MELRGQVAEQDLPLLRSVRRRRCASRARADLFRARCGCSGAVIDPQTRLGTVRVALQPDPNLRPGALPAPR